MREVTGKPLGIKTVVGTEAGVQGLFDEIKARDAASAPDFITIDGGEGGTGAAPMPLIDLVGMSIRERGAALSRGYAQSRGLERSCAHHREW